MINVTKSFLPPIEEFNKKIAAIWENGWLTNNGPNVLELEEKLRNYLGVKHCFYTGNGTIALQIALKALNIKNEVITTPFSYVATTTSILWENCKPIFVDINKNDFNIDVTKIEEAITPDTEAILAVHVYGNPCDVYSIEAIAKKYKLKVIYDAAHAFGTIYNNKQLLSFGDISTCSFHATKIFQTIEGGAIITNDDEFAKTIINYRSFGHLGDNYYSIGINGKNSEFHAAMGLCNLPYMEQIIEDRKNAYEYYDLLIKDTILVTPNPIKSTIQNYAYYAVLFINEEQLLNVKNELQKKGINTRRYFYPSLNNLPYHKGENCPVSEDISTRVLCLPLFTDLKKEEIKSIVNIIKSHI